ADPGVLEHHREQALEGPDGFRLVESAVRYREGLIYLVDHPRLLVALHGRVDDRDLFAAISLASLCKRRALRDPLAAPATRNAHLASDAPVDEPARHDLESVVRETPGLAPAVDEDELAHPKVPPPSPAVPAAELIEAARAVGVATVAAPDVYYALPAGAEDHRVRVAIKHNALECDLPPEWTARDLQPAAPGRYRPRIGRLSFARWR
ncbi:MAG: hypothetical protein AAF585_00520, partial [Verrucomicrobiota bacterium]